MKKFAALDKNIKCFINFLSLFPDAYRSSDIVLKWRSPDEEAIFIAKSLINDGLYTLKKFDTIATSSKTSTGQLMIIN